MAMLFIDGEDYQVNTGFAKELCKQRQLDLNKITDIATNDERLLMLELYNQGKLYIE